MHGRHHNRHVHRRGIPFLKDGTEPLGVNSLVEGPPNNAVVSVGLPPDNAVVSIIPGAVDGATSVLANPTAVVTIIYGTGISSAVGGVVSTALGSVETVVGSVVSSLLPTLTIPITIPTILPTIVASSTNSSGTTPTPITTSSAPRKPNNCASTGL